MEKRFRQLIPWSESLSVVYLYIAVSSMLVLYKWVLASTAEMLR